MDIEKIREYRLADPFRPFFLVLEDGRKLPVDKPFYLGFSPNKSFVTHSTLDGWFERVRPSAVRGVDLMTAEEVAAIEAMVKGNGE